MNNINKVESEDKFNLFSELDVIWLTISNLVNKVNKYIISYKDIIIAHIELTLAICL
jgi:hypothetical protein